MLRIQTFDARAGGNVIYKALAHPLAAEAIDRLYAPLEGPVALYDPDGIADALLAMYPAAVRHACSSTMSALVGETRGGLTAQPLTRIGRQRRAHRADRRLRCGTNRRPRSPTCCRPARRC